MNEEELLVDEDQYTSCGVHIGTRQKSINMEPFFYTVRNDGLYILDIKKTDERIRVAAKMLARYEPSSILVVSTRQYGQFPAAVFAKTLGAGIVAGRFMPGMLTNPGNPGYIEPEVLFVTDPIGDSQAVREAIVSGIPIIAMCDVNNGTDFIDLIIPTNNKGRRSLAFVYWLLTREILKTRGQISDYGEYKMTIEDFEASLE